MALAGRHAVDCVAHRVPVAGAQRRAHLPRLLFVAQRVVRGLRVPRERPLFVRTRTLVADPRPEVRLVARAEELAEGAFERLRGRLRVVSRQAQRREHQDLAVGARLRVPRGVLEQLLRACCRLREARLVRQGVLRQIVERALRRRDLAVLEQHAHAPPHVVRADRAAPGQRVDKRAAAIGQVARLEPDPVHGVQRHALAARDARQPCVAADLEVG
jgi:hypothetical protein